MEVILSNTITLEMPRYLARPLVGDTYKCTKKASFCQFLGTFLQSIA